MEAIRCLLVAFRLNYFSYKVPICALSSSYQPQFDGQLDCHTSTKMVPSEVVYGQMPPTVLFSYIFVLLCLSCGQRAEGLRSGFSVHKDNLGGAQAWMKQQVDKNRTDCSFIGHMVNLKLQLPKPDNNCY